MNSARRCIVRGRVQGVFYRDSTRRKAEELGVSGVARNLADGSVEVLAFGEERAVESLCTWLWQGPAAARVDDVSCETCRFESVSGFSTA